MKALGFFMLEIYNKGSYGSKGSGCGGRTFQLLQNALEGIAIFSMGLDIPPPLDLANIVSPMDTLGNPKKPCQNYTLVCTCKRTHKRYDTNIEDISPLLSFKS
jgi:hypothetical protein